MIKDLFSALLTRPLRWLMAGIAATIVLAIFMEGIAPIVLGGPMKPAGLICQALGWDNDMMLVAEFMHYALGVIFFAIGYVVFLGITGMSGGIVSGAIWGVILWIAAGTIMMTLAGQPLMFGFGKTMVASLVAHVAYGIVLGLVFGSRPLNPNMERQTL